MAPVLFVQKPTLLLNSTNKPSHPRKPSTKQINKRKEKASIGVTPDQYMPLIFKYLLTENLIMLPTFIACFLSNLLTKAKASTPLICAKKINNNNN